MTWQLQCPQGQVLALEQGVDVFAGSADECGLRLRGAGIPAQLAVVARDGSDAWLRVLGAEPPVGVNGRPVRSLARLHAGDRICFGAFCVDLRGPIPPATSNERRLESWTLRVRGGRGSGSLHPGPTVHLSAEGERVSAAAGAVGLVLVDGVLYLDPGSARVRIDGHPVTAEQPVPGGTQVQVGTRRYLVETIAAPPPDVVTERLRAAEDQQPAATTGADAWGLWGLVGLAALIAAVVAALLYFQR